MKRFKHANIKNLSSRLFLFAIAFIGLLFFTNDFTLVDVEKTAIIVALGIDKEEDEYALSAQIITPTKQDNGKTNSQVVIKSNGKTVSEAINGIHSLTGWYPKLNFCNLLVLGESVLTDDAILPLTFFFRSEHFNDSAMVIGSSGEASVLLEKTAPLDNLSSSALQKIVDRSNTKINDVISVNLKDIMKAFFSKGNSFLLPYAETKKLQEEKDPEAQSGGGEEVVFDMTSSAIIKDKKMIAKFDKRQTRAYSLITDKKSKAYYSVTNISPDIAIEIAIQEKSVKQKYDIVGGKVLYSVKLNVTSRFLDEIKDKHDLSGLSNTLYLSAETIEEIEKSIYKDIKTLFKTSVENRADFLNIASYLYKYKTKKYEQHITTLTSPDDLLLDAQIQIDITVKSQ